MKNIIIAALSACIFYGYGAYLSVIVFIVILAAGERIDRRIEAYKRSLKRGNRLNAKINRAKRGCKKLLEKNLLY